MISEERLREIARSVTEVDDAIDRMANDEIKHFTDPNCSYCGGEGFVESIDSVPYGSTSVVMRGGEWCDCWIDSLQEALDKASLRMMLEDRASLVSEVNAVLGELDEVVDTINNLNEKINEIGIRIGESLEIDDDTKAQYRNEYTRTSWNNDALEGFAAAHPAVLKFKRESKVKAGVSIYPKVKLSL